MALVPRNQIQLDAKYDNELIGKVLDLWKSGSDAARLERSSICFDAYKMNFRSVLSEDETWVQDYRVFLPLTPTIVDSVTTTMSNLMFPSNKFLRVDTDLTGDFWAKVATINLTKTEYIENTEEAVLEAAITGYLFWQTIFDGPFTKIMPISGADIRIYPQAKDISKVNKVLLIRLSGLDMEDDSVNYIGESVQELEKNVSEIGDEPGSKKKETPKANAFQNAEGGDLRYGAGHILYEAHIPKLKMSDHVVLRNIIVTVSETPRKLVRFTQLDAKRTINSIEGLPFSRVTPGEVFGDGIVKPILGIQSSINTMAAVELVGGLLDNMAGVSYNWADRTTRQLAKYWKMRPFSKWPATLQSNIQPIPKGPRRPFAQELFNWFSGQAYLLTNAQTAISGADNNADFATVARQQMQAANGKSAALARFWDAKYQQKNAFNAIQNAYDQMFPIVGFDQQTRQPQRKKDDQAILFWFQQVGFKDIEIFTKFTDQRFMSALSKLPGLTDIVPIGTRSVIERAESEARFRDTAITVNATPMTRTTKWNEVTKQAWENTGINNSEKFYYTDMEIAQITAEQQQQKQQQDNQINQDISNSMAQTAGVR